MDCLQEIPISRTADQDDTRLVVANPPFCCRRYLQWQKVDVALHGRGTMGQPVLPRTGKGRAGNPNPGHFEETWHRLNQDALALHSKAFLSFHRPIKIYHNLGNHVPLDLPLKDLNVSFHPWMTAVLR